MSDQGSAFHFPLLSADGHLMPPMPASSRQQTWNISEGDLGSGAGAGAGLGASRPLPNAPGTPVEPYEYEQYQEYQYSYSPNPSYENDNHYENEMDEKAVLSYYEEEPEPRVHLVAPTPRTPKRWSYEPPHSTPSPERSDEGSNSHQVIGLYPSIEYRGDGSIDYGYGQRRGVDDDASIRSSPRVAQVQDTFGFHQPQSATYHRSFSAEGEDIMADR